MDTMKIKVWWGKGKYRRKKGSVERIQENKKQ